MGVRQLLSPCSHWAAANDRTHGNATVIHCSRYVRCKVLQEDSPQPARAAGATTRAVGAERSRAHQSAISYAVDTVIVLLPAVSSRPCSAATQPYTAFLSSPPTRCRNRRENRSSSADNLVSILRLDG